MNRSTELARQAWHRIQAGWDPIESIAKAIRAALDERAGLDDASGLPPAQRDAVRILRRLGVVSPQALGLYRGRKIDGARRLVLRMLDRGIVRRIARGQYVLSGRWRRAA